MASTDTSNPLLPKTRFFTSLLLLVLTPYIKSFYHTPLFDTVTNVNIDHIIFTFNSQQVRYLLIGGMHFLLRHKPVLTFDIDFWIEDTAANRQRCETALSALHAEWGPTEETWKSVSSLPPGWLGRQFVYCLSSPFGAIDIFRSVAGLASWSDSFTSAVAGQTASGTRYVGLSDSDMLKCQLGLDPEDRKNDRIRDLQKILSSYGSSDSK